MNRGRFRQHSGKRRICWRAWPRSPVPGRGQEERSRQGSARPARGGLPPMPPFVHIAASLWAMTGSGAHRMGRSRRGPGCSRPCWARAAAASVCSSFLPLWPSSRFWAAPKKRSLIRPDRKMRAGRAKYFIIHLDEIIARGPTEREIRMAKSPEEIVRFVADYWEIPEGTSWDVW